MSSNRIVLSFCLLLVSLGSLNAQVFQSPFSMQGIGEIQNPRLVRFQGMGDVSVAASGKNFITLSNPASYSFMTSFDFEFAVKNELYQIRNAVDTFRSVDFNLPYMSFAFPIDSARKIGFSAGLSPLSQTGFKTVRNITSPLSASIYDTGWGGFNKLYAGISFPIVKNLYLGADAAYVFGSRNLTNILIFNDPGYYNTIQQTNLYIRDFVFDAGLLYIQPLKNDYKLQIGLRADLPTKLKTRREYKAFSSTTNLVDTIASLQRDTGNIVMPWGGTLGINLNNGKNWLVEIDGSYRPWSQQTIFGNPAGLNNAMSIGIGGEWVPVNSSTNSPVYSGAGNYIRRISYRAGLNATNSLYNINGTQAKDMSASLGFGFPVMKKGKTIEEASMIDFAFRYGLLGKTDETLVQKNYFLISLGLHLYESDWFFHRKID